MWLLPETTTPESTAKVGKGWKKYLSSNWRCKTKGYSKLWSKDVHKILATNVLFLWLILGFFLVNKLLFFLN